MKLKQRIIIGVTCMVAWFTIYKMFQVVNDDEETILNDLRLAEKPIVPQKVIKNAENEQKPDDVIEKPNDVIEKPNDVIENSPMFIKQDSAARNEFVQSELDRLQLDFQAADVSDFKKLYKVAGSWVNERQIYPYQHPELAAILKLMASAKIMKADALPKGTQIKLLLVLEGGQRVVFKQKRYARDHIIEGKPYDGYDRHNAEIAAFHLDRILDYRRSPLVVGRVVNLKTEIMPVATTRLLDTFREKDGNICYFGVCLYCNEKNMACGDGDVIEGSVTLWLPEKWSVFEKLRHPYQRTYVDNRMARWEKDETYCEKVVKHQPPYDRGTRLLDVADAAVFDYLIGNADRHHYEIFKNKSKDAMLLMLDNAKSFGNPSHHEPSILAPLRQCCM
uniref:glycosaminoglycan xylosylkinase n=1 Tax=Ciona intestinalis TaxID=7719 RepID=UPI0002B8D3EC|nr:glycosaminoglycan xylosylkinase [Ciona intestinalis]|eukprot:XP_002122861.4 glycosaminoglycan xylosylkinase [Ciona intestinalis]